MARRMRQIRSNEEEQYYERDIRIGADGSLIRDGDFVYMLGSRRVLQVDYFYRFLPDVGAVGKMIEFKIRFYAYEVVSASKGILVFAVSAIQRKWRKGSYTRSRKHSLRLQGAA